MQSPPPWPEIKSKSQPTVDPFDQWLGGPSSSTTTTTATGQGMGHQMGQQFGQKSIMEINNVNNNTGASGTFLSQNGQMINENNKQPQSQIRMLSTSDNDNFNNDNHDNNENHADQKDETSDENTTTKNYHNNNNNNDDEKKKDCFGDLVSMSFGKSNNIGHKNSDLRNSNSNMSNIQIEQSYENANSSSNSAPRSSGVIMVEDVFSDEEEEQDVDEGGREGDDTSCGSYQVQEMFPSKEKLVLTSGVSGDVTSSDPSKEEAIFFTSGHSPNTISNTPSVENCNTVVKDEEDKSCNPIDNEDKDIKSPAIISSSGAWGESFPLNPTSTIPGNNNDGDGVGDNNVDYDDDHDPFKNCKPSSSSDSAIPPPPNYLHAACTNAEFTAISMNDVADRNIGCNDEEDEDDPFKNCQPRPAHAATTTFEFATAMIPIARTMTKAQSVMSIAEKSDDPFKDCGVQSANVNGAGAAPYPALISPALTSTTMNTPMGNATLPMDVTSNNSNAANASENSSTLSSILPNMTDAQTPLLGSSAMTLSSSQGDTASASHEVISTPKTPQDSNFGNSSTVLTKSYTENSSASNEFGFYNPNPESSMMNSSSFPIQIPSQQQSPTQSSSNVSTNDADTPGVQTSLLWGSPAPMPTKQTNVDDNDEVDFLLSFMGGTAAPKATSTTEASPNRTLSSAPAPTKSGMDDNEYSSQPSMIGQTQSLGISKAIRQGPLQPQQQHQQQSHSNPNDLSEVTIVNNDPIANSSSHHPSGNATITTAGSTNVQDDWSFKSPNNITVRKLEENYDMGSYYDKNRSGSDSSSDDEENMGKMSNKTSHHNGRGDEECQEGTSKRRKRRNKGKPSLSDQRDNDEDEDVAIHPGMVAYTGFDEEDGSQSHKKTHYKKMHKNVDMGTKPKKKKRMMLIILCILLLVGLALGIYFLYSIDSSSRTSSETTNVNINGGNVDSNSADDAFSETITTMEDSLENSTGAEGNSFPTISPVNDTFGNALYQSNISAVENGENITTNEESESDDDFLGALHLTQEPTPLATTIPSLFPTNATKLNETTSPAPSISSSPTFSPSTTYVNSTAPSEHFSASPSFEPSSTPSALVNVANSTYPANVTYNATNSGENLQTAAGDNLVNGIRKSYGIIFDVQLGPGFSYLKITGMELYLDTVFQSHYEVWTKEGSWKDANGAYSDWTEEFREVAHGTISGAGACQPSHIDNCTFATIPPNDFESVELVGAGSRQSFYVTLTTDDLISQNYIRDNERLRTLDDTIYSSSPELDIFYGASVLKYPLSMADPDTDFRVGRGFVGRIWYQTYPEEAVSDFNVTSNNTDNMFNVTPTHGPTVYSTDNSSFFTLAPTPLASSYYPTPVVSTSTPTSPPTKEPTPKSCFYHTEESCEEAARALGLSLGGGGFPFAGKYRRSGCHFYSCENCLYGGFAYFGTDGTESDMESFHSVHDEERLSCETVPCDVSGHSSVWCLFPNIGACANTRSFFGFGSSTDNYGECDND